MRNPSADQAGRSAAGGSKTTPCCSKVGIKRGPWTAEEDEILAGYIKREGEGQWRTLPKRAGLLRCGKSCRLRWMNYLRPHLKRGFISPDEEDLILRLHRLLGNRWSLIAGRIPGRTDNEIKNYWNTHLSKKLINQGLDPRTHKPLEIYYNPNPNNHSSPISDPAFNNSSNNNNHHVIRSSTPAQQASTNPNPILATPASNDPLPPPVISNQLQEASTSCVSNGVDTNYRGEEADHHHHHHHHDGSNYNDDMFSSFLDLDALIMNDDDVFPQPNRASTNGDDHQLFQGQLSSSSSMMMMMQQPMGYGSNFQGFDHCSAVWGPSDVSPFSGFSNQGNRNVDPELAGKYIYVSARFRMRIHV